MQAWFRRGHSLRFVFKNIATLLSFLLLTTIQAVDLPNTSKNSYKQDGLVSAFSHSSIVELRKAVQFEKNNKALVNKNVVSNILEDPNVNTVAEFVKRLPESYRMHYVLAYRSRSEQGASFQQPRIIFYGEDGRTFIAVTAHPENNANNTVEMIEWDSEKLTWSKENFSEIKFDTKKNARAKFSESVSCFDCHRSGSDDRGARLHWNPYFRWPDFYFHNDDSTEFRMLPDEDNDNAALSKITSGQEKIEMAKFFKTYKSHPLYSLLPHLESRYQIEGAAVDKPVRPNLELTDIVFARTYLKIASEITRTEGYSDFKSLFFYLLRCSTARSEETNRALRSELAKLLFPNYQNPDQFNIAKLFSYPPIKARRDKLKKSFAYDDKPKDPLSVNEFEVFDAAITLDTVFGTNFMDDNKAASSWITLFKKKDYRSSYAIYGTSGADSMNVQLALTAIDPELEKLQRAENCDKCLQVVVNDVKKLKKDTLVKKSPWPPLALQAVESWLMNSLMNQGAPVENKEDH